MEDILSSIKRIITEDGAVVPPRGRRAVPAAEPRGFEAASAGPAFEGEPAVLELTDAIDEDREEPVKMPPAAAAEPPRAEAAPAPAAPELVSANAAAASRQSLAALSSMLVRPAAATGDNTLEGLVRELLRPMLKDWLDANLPALVEELVQKEIARIAGEGR